MISLTFFTASRTPLPPKRFLSPSRSSTASCSPVEAPLGTAARPAAPLDRVTSHSTVGLPRLSRISRAWTEMMVLMSDPTLRDGRGRVNARAQGFDGGAHPVAQRLPVVQRHPGRRDRVSHQQPYRPRVKHAAALGQDLEFVIH